MAINQVLDLWQQLDAIAKPYLSPIETEEQYQETLSFFEELWDKVGDNPNSPYGSLLKLLSDKLHAYELVQHNLPEASPQQVLKFLMEEYQLSQKELEAATGIYQSNLSQILRGKRNLSTQQVKLLATYFKVSPEALL